MKEICSGRRRSIAMRFFFVFFLYAIDRELKRVYFSRRQLIEVCRGAFLEAAGWPFPFEFPGLI